MNCVAHAGPTTLQALPASLQEAIFRLCDNKSQHALAQTCRLYWTLYRDLKCVSIWKGQQTTHFYTASVTWQNERTEEAARTLAGPFRANLVRKPLNSALFPDNNHCYHASLIGHLNQSHLLYILQHPKPAFTWRQGQFAAYAMGRYNEMLKVHPSTVDIVLVFTLQVYHSRQAGLSDDEHDKLSAYFQSFPAQICRCFSDQMLHAAADRHAPVKVVCEPVWQLISPSKVASCMYWDTEDPDYVHYVGDVSNLIFKHVQQLTG